MLRRVKFLSIVGGLIIVGIVVFFIFGLRSATIKVLKV